MPFGTIHVFLRSLANSAISSFYSQIVVVNQNDEDEQDGTFDGTDQVVTKDPGPFLVVCNHWNSAVDPAVLSCRFPHKHRLHYWAKSTLFKPGFAAKILLDAGNLPVDRRTKVGSDYAIRRCWALINDGQDNQKLFASTFDVLKFGEGVAIFPEGGSFTSPGLLPLKDGTAWAALEYGKNIRMTGRTLSDGRQAPSAPKDVKIFIAGVSYTDKSRYRSSVLMRFGRTIDTSKYIDEFLEDPKATVKKLTKEIEIRMREVTVNAPDWDTLTAATMARRMLWLRDQKLPMAHLDEIGQTLVDIFATKDDSDINALRALLVAYQASLKRAKLSHSSLSGVPLPATLDPSIPHPLPTRFRTLFQLALSTLSSLIRLPFFVVPLAVHLPIYLVGKYSLRFSEDEEDLAQNKIVLSLVLGTILFPTLGWLSWYLLFRTPLGGFAAVGFIWLFAAYHNRMVDNQYDAAKKLVASWRVLLGTWAPRARTEAVAALRRLGIEARVEGENEVRRALRMRIEASTALSEWMTKREIEQDEQVAKLLGWGASFKRPKPLGKSLASFQVGSPVLSDVGALPE